MFASQPDSRRVLISSSSGSSYAFIHKNSHEMSLSPTAQQSSQALLLSDCKRVALKYCLICILDYFWMLILLKSNQFTASLEDPCQVLLLADALLYVHVRCREIALATTWSQPTDFPIGASFKPTVYFDTSELGIKRWQRSDQWCREADGISATL